MGKNDNVQSVERAFLILDVMRDNPAGMGISQIAKTVGLKTTTAHRILQTLFQIGVVEQEAASRCYMLSPNIMLYGKAVLSRYDFIKSAHPMLGELSKIIGETVFMGVEYNYELVYVDHVDSLDHVLRMTPQIGRRQPLHCTALGKSLLAFMPKDRRDTFLAQTPHEQLTEDTITDPTTLAQELKRVKKQGFSTDLEEAEVGICCVGAPVFGQNGRVVAAISVSGPATRMKKKGITPFIADTVIQAAEKISNIVLT